MLAVTGGLDGEPAVIEDQPDARCSRDLCLSALVRGDRQWRVLATRSGYQLDAGELSAACAGADVVVSDRRLPRGCAPRWLRLDPEALARTGGVTVSFAGERVTAVRVPGDEHPWIARPLAEARDRYRHRRFAPLPGGPEQR